MVVEALDAAACGWRGTYVTVIALYTGLGVYNAYIDERLKAREKGKRERVALCAL